MHLVRCLRVVLAMKDDKQKIQVVLRANFDGETAEDSSGHGNHGEVIGNPCYDDGYDGGRAIFFQNPFGRKQNASYIRFNNLKGIDLTQDDFSIMFWYKTRCGGTQTWAASWDVCQAGWGVDMPGVSMGGVVFSNRDAFDFDASGILAAQLPLNQYFSVGLTGDHGARREIDGIWEPQDSRWHHLTILCSRSQGNCSVYVDGQQKAEVDLSAWEGQRLGDNTLTLGADIQGQYGLCNVWVDRFEVYAGVMKPEQVQAHFAYFRVRRLAQEILCRLDVPSSLHAWQARRELSAQVEGVRLEQGSFSQDSPPETQHRLYERLKTAYEAYLAWPMEKANLSMLLCSDLHIREAGDAGAVALSKAFQDLDKWKASLDGIINPGDFAAGASEAVAHAAYDVMDHLLEKHPGWQVIACFGNHESNYVSSEENYLTGSQAYWQHMQRYIANGCQRTFGQGVLDSVQNFSYGMTLKGYHFLVLNTDYLPQVGDGRSDWDTNALDPIRHGLYLEQDSYVWLESNLQKYRKDGKPIFVISHSPFVDTVPLSYFRRIRIRDNSVGPQDSRLRNLLGRYPGVIYLCGHLHLSLGVTGPVVVENGQGGRFVEITLPSFLNAKRAYRAVPASWIMYVYEQEIILRARNFLTGQWLTEYDCALPLDGLHTAEDDGKGR